MKKVVSVLLTLCLCFSALPFTVTASTERHGPVYYKLTDDTAVLTSANKTISANQGYEIFIIPSQVFWEYTVVEIADNAFSKFPTLESITIAETVTKVGKNAFGKCSKLETVVVFNPDCEFVENSGFNSNQTIYGFKGSTAEALAKNIGAKFVNVKKVHNHKYEGTVCEEPTHCTICGAKGRDKEHCFFECYGTCVDCGVRFYEDSHLYLVNVTKATFKKNGRMDYNCGCCPAVKPSTKIRRVKSVKLSYTKYAYNGEVRKPVVTVKDTAGKKLKKGTDYTVKYSKGRKKVGTYKVTVTLKGNYEGKKVLTFKITPPKTKIPKITAKKESLKVRISRKPSNADGYQIQYSATKTFKSSKKITVKNAKTPSATIKNLKANKTYFVRVRTYKTVDGKKYYSAWSSYKSKKTK